MSVGLMYDTESSTRRVASCHRRADVGDFLSALPQGQVADLELVFLGPADYSSTAGYRGQWEGQGGAKELLAIKDTLRAHGKHCGIMTTSHENLIERRLQGFRVLGLGTDSGLFLRSLHAALVVVGRAGKFP